MEYRYLGNTGIKVSELGIGTMQFGWTTDEKSAAIILTESYEAGINFIDTADIYSRWVDGNPGGIAEEIVGNWIKKTKINRESIIIATKVRGRTGNNPNDEGLSRTHIVYAVEGSLKRMKVDYIDLYQAHWYDQNTPIEETLRAMDDLIHDGKIRYIGCSNFRAWQLLEALWTSDRKNIANFISIQPHYNLVHRAEFEREIEKVCLKYKIGVIPYSPLAEGFLTGKYQQDLLSLASIRLERIKSYFNEKNWKLLATMQEFGRNYGVNSVSQIALAWLLKNPIISSVIIGPRTVEQFRDSLGCLKFRLNEEEKNTLDELSQWENDYK